MLSSYVDAQAMGALVQSTFALHEERLLAAAGLDVHAGKDMIVNIPNIILAFAGRVRPACAGTACARLNPSPQVLLNKTPFYLERGRCYGLIGQNGVGKTTLLTRIAAGDINNFPKEVSCYYIQHEILAEAGTGVLTFMLGQVRCAVASSSVRTAADTCCVALRCRRVVARTASSLPSTP